MEELDDYEQKLLEGWEEVTKKGQLTLWIMLALKEGPKHMSEIREFIHTATSGALGADDKSLYRALRRYNEAEMVNFKTRPGTNGPDLKIYSLSRIGQKVLNQFIKRNFLDIFFKPDIKALLERDIK